MRATVRSTGVRALAPCAVFAVLASATALPAGAEPVPPDAGSVPPPDTGVVASSPPTVVTTPDGWVVTLSATDESQLPVAPLTTAVSSRSYLAGATFTGAVTGSGSTALQGGTLEVGYQIGCGISLDKVTLDGNLGLSGFDIFPLPDSLDFEAGIGGSIEVDMLPGEVQNVQVISKEFTGRTTRVTVKDIHISIDGCVGQSFLRSYATLTSSTAAADDIVSYYGPTNSV